MNTSGRRVFDNAHHDTTPLFTSQSRLQMVLFPQGHIAITESPPLIGETIPSLAPVEPLTIWGIFEYTSKFNAYKINLLLCNVQFWLLPQYNVFGQNQFTLQTGKGKII